LKKNYQIIQTQNSLFYSKDRIEKSELIMHVGLTNFEQKSVDIITQSGGNILEVGFGMGISADAFYSKNFNTYTCVEINDYIFQNSQNWVTNKNNVSTLNDSWQNFFETASNKFDVVYCDSLDYDEYEEFYQKVKNVLNVGGIVSTYGSGVYFGTTNMNVVENILAPSSFDDDFTQQSYDRMVSRGYYKVYWQYFDGSNFVKTLD
jgi:spermidine synthase